LADVIQLVRQVLPAYYFGQRAELLDPLGIASNKKSFFFLSLKRPLRGIRDLVRDLKMS
jgi:hypothetical protein